FGFKKSGVFHACINMIRIMERRLQVPDTLELPGMLRPVVPLVCAWYAVVNEFVAFARRHSVRAGSRPATRRVPRFSTIVGTLNDLPKPRTCLRSVNPIRIGR